jgi:pimeloyl-ACP methyl ester carboxylesterase
MPELSEYSVTVGERTIAVRVRGLRREPAVLLLHGGGFDQRIWEHCASALAERCRSVTLDLPGHGVSRGPAIRDVAEAAELIDAVRAELGIDRWVFVGHSMGGAIAQAYARRFSTRVTALGLISTAPHFGLPSDTVDQWRAEGRSYSPERLDAIVAREASEAMRRHVLALREHMTPDGIQGDLDTCATWDGRVFAYDYELPVLVMSTPDDLPVLRAATEAWAEKLPRAEKVLIAGAGHMLMVERPDETTAVIRSWIERVSGARA